MTRRSRVLSYGSAALLVIAGIVAVTVLGGTVGQVLALALLSLGFVLATALVFYEVGLSEDRERAQAARDAEDRAQGETRTAQLGSRPSRLTPGLGRMRGSRRRLP